ncbi:uncharacterized protein N7459_005017 [Penicillium hispanicum]|uniref:uncharacterized protein n=1 Tax=Penicillium hispanicum TaxID=1080232 RepID=UPI002540D167|nr:uncharacterized protein N7459_005017 [Penicillium hispanicum]KAJ5585217.1 hypothetical protein N7459_005017 [Penicillium hispanicum]
MTPRDREVIGEQPGVMGLVMASLQEAYPNGVVPISDDGRVLMSDWGFALDRLALKDLRLWYGTDSNTPAMVGCHMAERIPHPVLKELDGRGI